MLCVEKPTVDASTPVLVMLSFARALDNNKQYQVGLIRKIGSTGVVDAELLYRQKVLGVR